MAPWALLSDGIWQDTKGVALWYWRDRIPSQGFNGSQDLWSALCGLRVAESKTMWSGTKAISGVTVDRWPMMEGIPWCLGSVSPWDLGPTPATWRKQEESQYHLKVKFPVSLAGEGLWVEIKLIYGKILTCYISCTSEYVAWDSYLLPVHFGRWTRRAGGQSRHRFKMGNQPTKARGTRKRRNAPWTETWSPGLAMQGLYAFIIRMKQVIFMKIGNGFYLKTFYYFFLFCLHKNRNLFS